MSETTERWTPGRWSLIGGGVLVVLLTVVKIAWHPEPSWRAQRDLAKNHRLGEADVAPRWFAPAGSETPTGRYLAEAKAKDELIRPDDLRSMPDLRPLGADRAVALVPLAQDELPLVSLLGPGTAVRLCCRETRGGGTKPETDEPAETETGDAEEEQGEEGEAPDTAQEDPAQTGEDEAGEEEKADEPQEEENPQEGEKPQEAGEVAASWTCIDPVLEVAAVLAEGEPVTSGDLALAVPRSVDPTRLEVCLTAERRRFWVVTGEAVAGR